MLLEELNAFGCCPVVPRLIDSLVAPGDVLAHLVKNTTAHVFELPKRVDGQLLTCIVLDCLNDQLQIVSQILANAAVESMLLER